MNTRTHKYMQTNNSTTCASENQYNGRKWCIFIAASSLWNTFPDNSEAAENISACRRHFSWLVWFLR